jgi:biotin transport system substrate-specific component
MLRTLPMTRRAPLVQRLLLIAFFTALMILSAQAKLYFGSPVPVTFQVLVVLLAGMVLGARDGALSQIAYLGLLALNLPVDAAASGIGALTGATAGYLISFAPAALITGLLTERAGDRLLLRWASGLAGIAVIYISGVIVLKAVTGMDWGAVWMAGVAPFVLLDMLKAVVAAGLSEGLRALIVRLPPV